MSRNGAVCRETIDTLKPWSILSQVERYYPIRQTIVNVEQEGTIFNCEFIPIPTYKMIKDAIIKGSFKKVDMS